MTVEPFALSDEELVAITDDPTVPMADRQAAAREWKRRKDWAN